MTPSLGSLIKMPTKTNLIPSSLRIVVLGSSGVGKSAIVMQYVRGVFVESYDPTLEDSFTKRVDLGSHYDPIDIEILDTAGTDQFSAMRDMYIGNGDVFLLVYSVDSKVSFNEACSLYERIKSIKNTKSCVMIVGNKSDLSNKHRKVTYEQGSFFAHQNRCSFMEVSARKNSGIKESFETLIKLHLNKRSPLIVTKQEEKIKITTNAKLKNSKKMSSIVNNKKDCIIM